MKKSLICFIAVLALAMSLPAAVFASGDQSVLSEGSATASDSSDEWLPATEEVLAEQEMIIAAAATDPTIVVDEIAIEENTGITPRTTTTSKIGATRYSGTSGKVSAYASFDKKATSATCTITLQEKYNGSWRTATGVPVKIYSKTVYNSYSITSSKTFTLVKGKVYRAKISIIDKNSSGSYYKTLYTGSF